MIRIHVIWDAEEKVFVCESPDMPELIAEFESEEKMKAELPELVQELLEGRKSKQDIPSDTIDVFYKAFTLTPACA